ncbi:NAD(P)/FAD-dependent oxidoreductase [Bordetella genomosp. 5]|uniref:FAD-binding domain-containing protein n=1 Tax=Bordetella genomosp. 5 TaxID=1395608 RepID=A0A261TQX2_9BORD|nr:NAD(P)/FAD-dependent oxidoreductase [Bordetella genomosp. 5]OZI52064.1 hypothetical protein CAL25_11225 [Bordetella genomosp. 5]
MPDVLVIGAGTAGAVIARQLALAGLQVMLVDEPTAGFKPGESLPGAAKPLLRDMGLLGALDDSAALPSYGNLVSWEDETLRETDFIRDPNGLGWHLDRAAFDACLRIAAQDAGVCLHHGRMRHVIRRADGWQVAWQALSFRDGHAALPLPQLDPRPGQTTARFLVDASGRHGVLGRRLGITRTVDPGLIAVYATAAIEGEDLRTVLEATPQGWWYSAPLPGRRCIAVLHTGPQQVSRLAHRQTEWLRALSATRHIQRFCPPTADWTTLCATSAAGSALDVVHGQGWLAVGDAALAFDPLSSQGIFNALYTALRGAQAVVAEFEGRDGPASGYAAQLQRVREQYLQRVGHFYRAQPRWHDQPFWAAQRARYR